MQHSQKVFLKIKIFLFVYIAIPVFCEIKFWGAFSIRTKINKK